MRAESQCRLPSTGKSTKSKNSYPLKSFNSLPIFKKDRKEAASYFGCWGCRITGCKGSYDIAVDSSASPCGRRMQSGWDNWYRQKTWPIVAIAVHCAVTVTVAVYMIPVGIPLPAIPSCAIISFKPAVVPWHLGKTSNCRFSPGFYQIAYQEPKQKTK